MSFNCIGCVDGIPLICGCMERRRKQRTPPKNGVPSWQPLRHTIVLVVHVCNQVHVIAIQTYFTLFCIPLFPVSRGPVWLGCLVCGQRVETRSARQLCESCGMFRGDARYCPRCGAAQRDAHF